MPKMKTHKASLGRMRLTRRGKILRRQCGVRHLLTNRSKKRKRNLRQATTTTAKGYVRRLRIMHQKGVPS